MIQEAKDQMNEIESLNTIDKNVIEQHLKGKLKIKQIEKSKKVDDAKDIYIKQGNSFPLDFNRIGQLPMSLEYFLLIYKYFLLKFYLKLLKH